ncbi:DUF934 domain-containing protein [Limibaculum sp. FT325]|uniref:DUF934 domain-containing protein n=1 Tax=Thermohalobaculum sediminis TaxID=2939436 RepID=UPI0020BED2B4|nr:DUF934 domain-containing protein [Limibaculum sediminis]MCL5777655.1 DUF934 domain-containing protein [Limibaculum sediminis]
MSLLIDRGGPIADPWVRVQRDEPLPDGPAIVDPDRLAGLDHAPLGVHLPNTADAAALASEFSRLALISIDFPAFNDGRGFSIARRLRELGYTGRLRAAGPVIADQFAYLLECGFDEVEIPDALAARQPAEHWLAAIARAGHAYQRGRTGARASILDARSADHG